MGTPHDNRLTKQWIKALDVWIARYQEALKITRQVEDQLRHYTDAFALVLEILTDDQLVELEERLAVPSGQLRAGLRAPGSDDDMVGGS